MIDRRGFIAALLVLLMGITVLRWWRNQDLLNYLHPDTIWLTAVGGLVAIGLVVWTVASRQTVRPERGQLAVLLLVVGLMIATNPTPLSFTLMRDRQIDGQQSRAGRGAIDIGKMTTQFTILDWQHAWESDPAHQRYLGKAVSVVGFLTRDADRIFVTRLVVTCCAIDARPVSLELAPAETLPVDEQWVKVDGVMSIAGSAPLVRVTAVTPIARPKNPYLR